MAQVFNFENGSTLRSFSRTARVRCVALTSSGHTVLSGGFDRQVQLRSVLDGVGIAHISVGRGSAQLELLTVHASGDGKRMAFGGRADDKGFVRLLCASTGVETASATHDEEVHLDTTKII